MRSELVCEANRPVNMLHKIASTKVCASAQAKAINSIMPMLSEDELAVFQKSAEKICDAQGDFVGFDCHLLHLFHKV